MPAQFTIPFEWLAIFVLAMTLGIVIKAYYDLLKGYRKVTLDKDVIEAGARKKAEEIVSEAKNEALRVMETAKADVQKEESVMEHELQEVTEGQVGEYKKSVQSISKKIEEDTLREFQMFKDTLSSETSQVQGEIKKRIEAEYEKMTQELSTARDKKYKDLETEAKQTLREISGKVLSKALSMDDHIELITRALEEAKKSHVF